MYFMHTQFVTGYINSHIKIYSYSNKSEDYTKDA